MEKIFLSVPFEEKGLVKSLGAKWDPTFKCWYILSNTSPKPFKKWLGITVKPTGKKITCDDNCFLLRGVLTCWRCKGFSSFYRFGTKAITYTDKTGTKSIEGFFVFHDISTFPESLELFIKTRCSGLKLSKNIAGKPRYYRNHCSHCFSGISDAAIFEASARQKYELIELPIGIGLDLQTNFEDYSTAAWLEKCKVLDFILDII